MPEDFGGRLRRKREEQGVALATIAERTKIKASLLEALERNDVSQWPPGIFRRAYIRAYAAAVGLDTDAVAQEFQALYPDRADMLRAEPTPALSDHNRASAPPTRLRYLMDSAIGSLGHRRRPSMSRPIVGVSSVDAAASRAPVAGADSTAARVSTEPAARRGSAVEVEVAEEKMWEELARLSTAFGGVTTAEDIQPLLLDAVRILHASGLIVWRWDADAAVLTPVLAAGYSDRIIAQLPTLRPDSDNLTADAFRLARTCSIPGDEGSSAALVVPMMGPAHCRGVIALELRCAGDPAPPVQAAATVLAALLSLLLGDTSAIAAAPSAASAR